MFFVGLFINKSKKLKSLFPVAIFNFFFDLFIFSIVHRLPARTMATPGVGAEAPSESRFPLVHDTEEKRRKAKAVGVPEAPLTDSSPAALDSSPGSTAPVSLLVLIVCEPSTDQITCLCRVSCGVCTPAVSHRRTEAGPLHPFCAWM